MSTRSAARQSPRRDVLIDAGVLLAAAVPVISGTVLEHPSPITAGWALLLLAPLAWRRSHPDLVMTVLTLLGTAQLLFSDSVTLANVTMLIGLYSTARHGDLRRSLGWLLVVIVGSGVAAVDWSRDEVGHVDAATHIRDMAALGGAMILLALLAWTSGHLARLSSVLIGVRAHAAAAAREQEIRLAVIAERAQIAREVHDIVGHSLALIAVQADAGRYVASAPEIDLSPSERLRQAEEVLEGIRSHAASALNETRTVTSAHALDGRRPLHRLEDIRGLIDEVRRSGRTITLSMNEFDHGDLDAATQAAVYRVVQEAVTNAVKHSQGKIGVRMDRSAEHLVVTVVNDRLHPSTASPHEGRGLVGMAERVHALAGTFEARPTPDGDFLLVASFPFSAGSQGKLR